MLYTVVRLFVTHTPHIHIYTCVTRAHMRNYRIFEVLTIVLFLSYIKVIQHALHDIEEIRTSVSVGSTKNGVLVKNSAVPSRVGTPLACTTYLAVDLEICCIIHEVGHTDVFLHTH